MLSSHIGGLWQVEDVDVRILVRGLLEHRDSRSGFRAFQDIAIFGLGVSGVGCQHFSGVRWHATCAWLCKPRPLMKILWQSVIFHLLRESLSPVCTVSRPGVNFCAA